MITKIRTFLSDVRSELVKASWPTRDEVVGSTGVVVFMIAAVAVFILVNDQVLSRAVSLLLIRN